MDTSGQHKPITVAFFMHDNVGKSFKIIWKFSWFTMSFDRRVENDNKRKWFCVSYAECFCVGGPPA